MFVTPRRLIVVGGVVVTLLLGGAATAHAGFSDPVNCTTEPTNPACVITITTGGGGDSGGGNSGCHAPNGQAIPCYIKGKGWYGGGSCWYQRATGDALRAAVALGGAVVPPAYWYVGTCGDPITNFWPPALTRFVVYDTNPGLVLLAREAVKHLNLPAPRIRASPATDAPQVVYVPTWLWVEPGDYTSRSATASLASLSVTAVATPTSVTWSTGDGATVSCGAGTAWTAGTDPAKASPDCGHTYTASSRLAADGGTYTLSATITWKVTWTGGGATGTEPALTSTSAVRLRVTESSSLDTK